MLLGDDPSSTTPFTPQNAMGALEKCGSSELLYNDDRYEMCARIRGRGLADCNWGSKLLEYTRDSMERKSQGIMKQDSSRISMYPTGKMRKAREGAVSRAIGPGFPQYI